MTSPKLTIGISFYNTAETLDDLMRCIFSQTLKDWELILIDDGSTDGGADVVSEVDDRRITLLRDGKNLGRSARYNQITAMANGQYIARFDADDLSMPDRFQKQVEFLDAHRSIDVVSTDMLSIDENGQVRGRRRNPASNEEICSNPLRHIYLAHGPIVGRTEWFRSHPYPEAFRVAIDYALLLSSYSDSCFASIQEPLYIYREYETHSLRKYARTAWSVAKAIWTFRRKPDGIFKAALGALLHCLRVVAYAGLTCAGLKKRLIQRRSSGASEEDKQLFSEALGVIRATPVAGLPNSSGQTSAALTDT